MHRLPLTEPRQHPRESISAARSAVIPGYLKLCKRRVRHTPPLVTVWCFLPTSIRCRLMARIVRPATFGRTEEPVPVSAAPGIPRARMGQPGSEGGSPSERKKLITGSDSVYYP